MTGKDLQKHLKDADIAQVGKFMSMFDRMLLYTIAVNFLPVEAIKGTVNLWDIVIKKGIDQDASGRTKFLEGTPEGRLAKYRNEPDGEEIRLHCLKQLQIAHSIITANLDKSQLKDDDDDDEDDYLVD